MVNVVPPLQIVRKLGNGHFGEVFLGQDSVHGQVAVKVLSRKSGQDATDWLEHKAGFLAEAQNLSKARHSNVVEVYRIDEEPGGDSIRFCMAYCPGGSLQQRFDCGAMSLAEVRKVATEVLLGLDSLHSRGMLHRDIKPGNILLAGNGIAQLGDFGLVTDKLILGYGSQAGYCDHIAHEVWHGQGTSRKTDIWALGMTLYRLLHGKTWYEQGPSPADVVKHGGFADTLRWLPHVPKSWRRVIRKMLNDDPGRRFQTASQVLNALSGLLTPEWRVSVALDQVKWEQQVKNRRRIVLWATHSARRHEWSAWSEPIGGTGRQMSLGGSSGVVSRSQAIRDLEEFFDA